MPSLAPLPRLSKTSKPLSAHESLLVAADEKSPLTQPFDHLHSKETRAVGSL